MACDPKFACLYFALIAIILILILMQLWGVGFYKNTSSESFVVKTARRVANPAYKKKQIGVKTERMANNGETINCGGLSSTDCDLLGQSGYSA